MTGSRSVFGWTIVFSAFFLLSLDFWWWGRSVVLGAFGLPTWVYYFVGLQLVLSLAIHLFSKTHWSRFGGGTDNDGDELE